MTNEQVQQNVRAAQARIKSGQLKENATNAWLIITYVTSKGLEPTVDNLYSAIVENVKALEWSQKPAALQREENETKVATITPAFKSAEERAKIEKAAAVADAKKKADAAALNRAYAVAASYQKIRRGKVIAGAQQEQRDKLKAYIDTQAAIPSVSRADILAKVEKYVADLYKADESAEERV